LVVVGVVVVEAWFVLVWGSVVVVKPTLDLMSASGPAVGVRGRGGGRVGSLEAFGSCSVPASVTLWWTGPARRCYPSRLMCRLSVIVVVVPLHLHI
jgi:hypothetical protein